MVVIPKYNKICIETYLNVGFELKYQYSNINV